jgi:DNA (cytosine-5)-methyltransferase 1
MNTFYEFFAGGGMARAGLGANWTCSFANDFDRKKIAAYSANWGADQLVHEDVRKIKPEQLPGRVDLAWASFPCQDLSLAGVGAGLRGDRSGAFWPFWRLMLGLKRQQRHPSIIVLENVCGALTSRGGKDFAAIGDALTEGGYRFGALVIDAALFVPQSRPRLFIVAVTSGLAVPCGLTVDKPGQQWHTRALMRAQAGLSSKAKAAWLWLTMPVPPLRNGSFSDVIEDNALDVEWHSPRETARLISMMSPINRKKLEKAKSSGRRLVGAIYKRTRLDEGGAKVQRAEVRFDDVSGCLRTPAGGSSRQLIAVVEGDCVKTRLISGRETARLMGLDDGYYLPSNYNDAYHLTGDGVVVPVVRHLAANILEPILRAPSKLRRAA